jgi:hypothetical protein
VVALGFALVLGVPFALGCAAMALPVRRLTKVVIALAPVLLLGLSIAMQVFWLADIGGLVIAFIATWAWLFGVGSSGDVRSLGRVVARGVRALA